MARSDSSVEVALNELLSRAVTPILKPARFRKSGTNYHRRHGDTVQVVNIQSSRGSTSEAKEFFINVGIAFDAICELAGVPVMENPKEYECDERGTRDRIEKLIPGIPASWSLQGGEDVSDISAELQKVMRQLLAELDQIDGLAAYRSHRWFDRFRPTQQNAQVLYLIRDMAGAWHEVQELADLFADRQNANRVEWWVDQLKLKKLENRIHPKPNT